MIFQQIIITLTVIAAFSLLYPPMWNGLIRSLIVVIDWAIVNLMMVTRAGKARAMTPEFFATISRRGWQLAAQGMSQDEIKLAVSMCIGLVLAGETVAPDTMPDDVIRKFVNRHTAEIESVFATYNQWAANQAA